MLVTVYSHFHKGVNGLTRNFSLPQVIELLLDTMSLKDS